MTGQAGDPWPARCAACLSRGDHGGAGPSQAGLPTSDAYAAALDPWTRLVLGASIEAPDGKGLISGQSRAAGNPAGNPSGCFGAGSAAALIVEAVLLHQSLSVVPEWPNPGSLAEAELASRITRRCCRCWKA